MRYFVTGGAGFIGSNYVEHLFKSVEGVSSVTVYDNFTYAANSRNYGESSLDPRFTVIRGDICDRKLLEKSMIGHDFVIHFAAESHVDRSINDSEIFVRTNVLGTSNVLEASLNTHIKTMVHVSTDEVYGSLVHGSAKEDWPLCPNSPYAASKASSDLLARSYFVTHNLDVRITRSSNNFGKYQFPEKIIPVFIQKLILGEKLPIYGDGKNIREWIHASDHAHGIQTVLEKGSPGEIYNIGTGDHLTNNDLAQKILDAMGFDQSFVSYIQDRKGHDFRYSIDSSKIRALGFNPKYSFNEGIREVIKWYQQNPNWWNSIT